MVTEDEQCSVITVRIRNSHILIFLECSMGINIKSQFGHYSEYTKAVFRYLKYTYYAQSAHAYCLVTGAVRLSFVFLLALMNKLTKLVRITM